MSAEELIRVCAESNDNAAWDEFVSRFHRPIALSILRTAYRWGAGTQQVLDDLIQETYLKLCANRCRMLHEFALQHPEAILPYIKTIAANIAHDHFKAMHSQKRGKGEIAQSLEDFEPEGSKAKQGSQELIEREVLLREVDHALEACSQGEDQQRDRLIFWLHYQQGMSASAIAALPTIDLTSKGVESVIYRLTRLVRDRILQLRAESQAPLQQEKGLRPAESY